MKNRTMDATDVMPHITAMVDSASDLMVWIDDAIARSILAYIISCGTNTVQKIMTDTRRTVTLFTRSQLRVIHQYANGAIAWLTVDKTDSITA